MTFLSGPFNIQQGNSVAFVVEFFDSLGAPTMPPSATMSISYINTSNVATVDNVTLSSVGFFFNGTWSTATAALGLATWTATALPSSVQAATGQIRVIQRRGN